MIPIINSPDKGHPDNNKGFIKIREINKHGIILQSTRAFLMQKYSFRYPHNYSLIDMVVSWAEGLI